MWVCSVCIKLQTTCRVSAAPDPKSRSHEALNHQTVYFPTSMCLWFCATCIFTHPHLFKRIDKLLCVACPCWTQESSMYAFSYMSSMSAICQFSFSFQLGQLFSSQLGHGPTGLHKQQEWQYMHWYVVVLSPHYVMCKIVAHQVDSMRQASASYHMAVIHEAGICLISWGICLISSPWGRHLPHIATLWHVQYSCTSGRHNEASASYFTIDMMALKFGLVYIVCELSF